VESPDGRWKAFFLGCRPYADDFYNTGRETFCVDVEWNDGWPKAVVPELVPTVHAFSYWKEFDGSALGPEWLYLRSKEEDPTPFYRQQHKNFSVHATLSRGSDGELLLFQNENYLISFSRKGGAVSLTRKEGDSESSFSARAPRGRLEMEVAGRGGIYTFRYRRPGGRWKTLSGDMDATNLSTHKAGGYVGTMIGLRSY